MAFKKMTQEEKKKYQKERRNWSRSWMKASRQCLKTDVLQTTLNCNPASVSIR